MNLKGLDKLRQTVKDHECDLSQELIQSETYEIKHRFSKNTHKLSQAMDEKDDRSGNHEKGDDESLSQDAKFIEQYFLNQFNSQE